MPADVQDAIATHELLHVRRHDWLHVIGEEAIRTVLWFRPAIWWLIARIQLTREHAVDNRVVALTQSRERYVEALLAVATTRNPVALVPASLFLRRRFLKKRLAHILQETTMTTRRLIASVTVSAGALTVAAILAVRSFPLEARGPQQAQGPAATAGPVQTVKGGAHLLHGALPEYPRRAIQQRIEGDVDLELTVDERGEVSDARVVSGPDELRRAALQAVLQWHFAPQSLRSTVTQVSLRFSAPAADAEAAEQEPEPQKFETSPAWRLERQLLELANALRDPGVSESQKLEYRHKYAEAQERLKQMRVDVSETHQESSVDITPRLIQIRMERVPAAVAQEIRERAGIGIGDPITEATARKISAIAKSVDEHLLVRFESDRRGGVVLAIIAP